MAWETNETEPGERPAVSDPRLRAPIATYNLIGANVVMYLMEVLWGGWDVAGATAFQMGANFGRVGLLHEPWRVLSYAFLHGDPTHIAMNMYALYILGSSTERLLGAGRMLTVYWLSALGGGFLSALLHEQYLGVGASGAIWGLMTAQILWVWRLQRHHGRQVVAGGFAQMAQPLLINLVISFMPGIDLFAHLGGGIAGAAAAMLFPMVLPAEDRPWRVAAGIGVLLMAASVVIAIVTGQPWAPLQE